MAEELDEGEFYREDFSTESYWEILNAQLSELLHKWQLTHTEFKCGREFEPNELYSCEWTVETETLALEKMEIEASYYAAKLDENSDDLNENTSQDYVAFHEDLMSLKNTFGPPLSNNNKDLHTLARVYGLRKFVLLHPKSSQQYFKTTAEFTYFLSTATVVCSESAVPIFVQIYNPEWNYYIGVGFAATLRTNFDLVAVEAAPMELKYLSGLLSMFKEKLRVTYIKPATVSVSLNYLLQKPDVRLTMHVPFARSTPEDEFSLVPLSKLESSCFIALPHGYFPSSCSFIYGIFNWPELSELLAIDSALRTDFMPSKAHECTTYFTVQATSYLSTAINDFLSLKNSQATLEQYVGRNFSGIANAAETGALDALTQPQLHSLHALKQKRHRNEGAMRKLPGPMKDSELNEMLAYLFPDLHAENALFPYSTRMFEAAEMQYNIKTAAADSLVHRLSCLLNTVNAHFGGKSGLAQLWAAFTRELRFKWDYCLIIQG